MEMLSKLLHIPQPDSLELGFAHRQSGSKVLAHEHYTPVPLTSYNFSGFFFFFACLFVCVFWGVLPTACRSSPAWD